MKLPRRSALAALSAIRSGRAPSRPRLRSGFFPQRKLDGVVISVGNLTVGGTGKTPMVLWIARATCSPKGKPAGILTRGYRGEAVSANAWP